jgi:GxxExxY protein
MNEDELSNLIIGAGIDVHKEVGPGLLESVYEECLAFELAVRKIPFERQKEIPLIYKGNNLPSNFRIDLLVGGLVIVELKSVENIIPIHEAQLLTYLKMTGCKLGLLLNFNVARLKDGIKRMVNDL